MMLHGIGMDWRVWQAISRRLSPAFHLLLVDLRGHGESDKPDHGYTVGHYAADIEELVDRLHLRDTVLLGSSLGGTVAAAAEIPADMVSHRILVDPPLTGGPVHDPETFRTILHLKREQSHALSDFLQTSNPGIGRFLAEMMSEMWHEAADGVITDMLADPDCFFDLDSSLRSIESPTLLLQADPSRGGVLSEVEAARALALLRRGELVRVAGAGHAIHATNPAQFVRLLTEFTGEVRSPGEIQLRHMPFPSSPE